MIIKIIYSLLTLIFFILFGGGLLSQILNPELFKNTSWTPPVFILIASLICLLNKNTKTIIILLLAGFLGFLSEIIGVKTGFPYGEYFYTETLGIKIFDVPIVLISSWIIITTFSLDILNSLHLNKFFFPILFSITSTTYDLLIDPLMSGPLNYWEWNNHGYYFGIPVSNFLGWIIVSAIIGLLPWKNYKTNKFSLIISFSLPIFFVYTALLNMLIVPSIIGILLIVILAIKNTLSLKKRVIN